MCWQWTWGLALPQVMSFLTPLICQIKFVRTIYQVSAENFTSYVNTVIICSSSSLDLTDFQVRMQSSFFVRTHLYITRII